MPDDRHVTPPKLDATTPSAPPEVQRLIENFERHYETYRSPAYNETQVRREFIDPLFEALGWDVHNKASHAAAYKDVIHEDAIKVAGESKAPDSLFTQCANNRPSFDSFVA